MARYYMFNKPKDCVSARYDERHKTVMDFFPMSERDTLFPVGRLDRDTEGLLIVTDDGKLCSRLLSPDSGVKKTYFFYALGNMTEELRQEIERGIKLYPTHDIISKPSVIKLISSCTLSDIKEYLSVIDMKKAQRKPQTPVFCGTVTVTEGKKHQVKRMLMYAGCRIVYLKRIKISDLHLDEALARGEYRPLTECELASLC